MSNLRKLLLAFAAVTLFAGIASAGIQPVLTTSAQPHSVRMEALAPENTLFSFDTGCNIGAGLQAPAWLNNFGVPAAMPAPNIAALNTAQAAGHLAGTPANLNSNFANKALHLLSQPLNSTSILDNTTNINTRFVAVDVGQMSDHFAASRVFNAANAVVQPGLAVVATHLAVPAVARTAPNNAGKNAG